MSTSVTLNLQTQVVSILEVLAKSAIAEISKVIEEGTDVFLLEMSRSKQENKTLKQRLLQMEKELLSARRDGKIRAVSGDKIGTAKVHVGDEIGGAGVPGRNRESNEENHPLSIDRVFGREWSLSLWQDGELAAVKEEEASQQPLITEEATLTVDDRPDLFSIKVELFEENLEDTDMHDGLQMSGCFESEDYSTERKDCKESDPQPASAEIAEEPYTLARAAGGLLEQGTLPVILEGTTEPQAFPSSPQSTAGSEDAGPYFPYGQTNVAEGHERAWRKQLAYTHCGRNFSDFFSFQEHQQTSSSRSGNQFCQKTELAHHEMGHKTFLNNCFSCEHCTEIFSCSYDLETHRVVHREKPFHCNDCGECYSEKQHLNSHLCSCAGEKTYKCIDCGDSFSQEISLSLHQCSRQREKQHSVKSGENSSQKSKFDSQHHIYREGSFYSCAVCQKSFTDLNTFTHYLCDRTVEKLHRCLECGKCFTKRRSLQVHLRTIHAGERPYSCAECGKNFTKKWNLKKHQVIHTGEKPYQCLECGKRFTEKGYLKKHYQIHRGVKPYRCRECGKCFFHKSRLNSHERNHRIRLI